MEEQAPPPPPPLSESEKTRARFNEIAGYINPRRQIAGKTTGAKKKAAAQARPPAAIVAPTVPDSHRMADIIREVTEARSDATHDPKWLEFIRGISEQSGNELKDIQCQSAIEMTKILRHSNTGCLGLAMGYGKTRTCAVIGRMVMEMLEECDSTVVITVGSLIPQFIEEVNKVYPNTQDGNDNNPGYNFPFYTLDCESIREPDVLRTIAKDAKKRRVWVFVDMSVLLQSSTTVLLAELNSIMAPIVMIDEPQGYFRKDKVMAGNISSCIRRLTMRLMVTGTPVLNKADECRNILNTFPPSGGAPFWASDTDAQLLFRALTVTNANMPAPDLNPGAIYNVMLENTHEEHVRKLPAKLQHRAATLGSHIPSHDKVEACMALVDRVSVQRREKMIVVVDSHDVIDKITAQLELNPKTADFILEFHGMLTKEKQTDNLRLFQEQEDKPWIMVTTMAFISKGYNLQMATLIVLFRPEYTRQILMQLWTRVYRFGQKGFPLMFVLHTSQREARMEKLSSAKVANNSAYYGDSATYKVDMGGLSHLEVKDVVHLYEGLRCLTERGMALRYGLGCSVHPMSPTQPKVINGTVIKYPPSARLAIAGLTLPWDPPCSA